MSEQEKAAAQAKAMATCFLGDMDAVRLCDGLFHVTQVWDDLVDGDKEVSGEEVCRAFWTALVEIPANPFWRAHAAELLPVLRGGINDWLDANALERGTTHERSVAFAIRDNVGALVSQIAYLKGGYEWMRRVSPEVRRMLHDETLGAYLRGLK